MKRLTTKEFISKARKVHGDRYVLIIPYWEKDIEGVVRKFLKK